MNIIANNILIRFVNLYTKKLNLGIKHHKSDLLNCDKEL